MKLRVQKYHERAGLYSSWEQQRECIEEQIVAHLRWKGWKPELVGVTLEAYATFGISFTMFKRGQPRQHYYFCMGP